MVTVRLIDFPCSLLVRLVNIGIYNVPVTLNSKSASTPFNRLSILLTQYGDFAKK